jgi:Na+/alanine symporter
VDELEPADAVLFWDAVFWDNGREGQIVVLWLALGAVFFTLRFQSINFRAFRHAIDCVRGRYTVPDETGEISHFQALSAALSATVGLGDIAGVLLLTSKVKESLDTYMTRLRAGEFRRYRD